MADIIDVPGMATLINNAVDLYDEGLLPECEAATRAILKHRLSRWQEIYCLALLADCLDDWYEAEVSQTNPLRVLESSNSDVCKLCHSHSTVSTPQIRATEMHSSLQNASRSLVVLHLASYLELNSLCSTASY